ncbi:DegQ family serine endoprotease [Paroceanicella profunda]|uniref:Probable periplasmic serine endoprotease DegP-like n=2 Tax=Paroceanicella profunda TaxID=2579971 RepID=A0A5B8G382_9RHOB|nr:DegQ family serine endoprotease [Paroceanicella profunda]QDL93732.1 DegQ family serine endoprotease [Paroceanicella profunda]
MAATVAVAQAPVVEARGAPDSFADLAAQLSPAVVNITTSQIVARRDEGPNPMVPEGSPFEEFFKNFRDRQRQSPERATALGSGFIISADGYIVTNNHVIESADEISIELFSGKNLDAKLIGTDPKTDIALLKVESDEPLPFVNFGDSDLARVGDWVMAIGNPLGQGFSVTAGIVSARNRSLRGSYDDFIQTDAAINRGNSGGPLFNMDGQVIGVNTAILSPNGGSIGIGFSMSSNVVKNVVDQLKDFGETRRGWLGVRIQPVDPAMAEALGLKEASGALVAGVTDDGPAAAAGIKGGDVILSFDGNDVKEMRDLPRMVADTKVGKAVRVVLFREGKTQTVLVTLGRLEENEVNASMEGGPTGDGAPQPSTDAQVLGMTLSAITPDMREQFGLPDDLQGIIVSDMDATSAAFEKGLRPGDVIMEVGQQPVATPADAEARVKAAKEAGRTSILMLVQREGEPRFVALKLED